jgi:hypothetical protein
MGRDPSFSHLHARHETSRGAPGPPWRYVRAVPPLVPRRQLRLTARVASVEGRSAGLTVPPSMISTFGEELLDYILAKGFARSQTLQVLTTMASEAAQTPDSLSQRRRLLSFFECTDISAGSVINQMRLANGGAIPDDVAADACSQALLGLAVDLFPAQLLPAATGDPAIASPRSPDISLLLVRNPRWVAFARAFLSDPALSTMFPGGAGAEPSDQPFPLNVMSEVIWSNGNGGGLQLAMVAESILAYMFWLMHIDGRLDVKELPHYVYKVMAIARALAGRERVRLPVVATFGNISFAENVNSLPFANGQLFPVSQLAPGFLHVPGRATTLSLVDTELQLLNVSPWDPSDDASEASNRLWTHLSPKMQASYRATERELIRVRLSVILASSDELLAPTLLTWSIPHPLMGGNASWASPAISAALRPASSIGRSTADAISDWSHRLSKHPESLWLGTRRLISAVAARDDALDAFVDAVICWENLLGTGEGEVVFRVCGSLALLLEPHEPDRRRSLFDELRTLYRARSGLVHGSREPDAAAAAAMRDRAVRVAIDAMRAVYDRPELRDARDSNERNRILLLGA